VYSKFNSSGTVPESISNYERSEAFNLKECKRVVKKYTNKQHPRFYAPAPSGKRNRARNSLHKPPLTVFSKNVTVLAVFALSFSILAKEET
jgi:hypothetical protein